MSTQSSIKQRYFSDPLFNWFKKSLPALSETEKAAMEAGSVWWDAELFSGDPDWKKLLDFPKPQLSEEEQYFIDNQLETLLAMLDDFDIVQQRKDLSADVWQYLKKEKFLSLIIPKEYGGLAFSALANSVIVGKIASRSLSAAVSVMVPNSLGPSELLTHYGTESQKKHWLPRLATGEDIPCFALTGPEAGSDAGAITDSGEICLGKYKGKEVLGITLTWNKRYITLAPMATVLGLAFKLYDPNKFLSEKKELGITCALIPTAHAGVEIGSRHNPLGLAFMNGPTQGKEVFIPLDWVIGGKDYIGKGWQMLMECLCAGRGISLPALATAIGQLAMRTTGAYASVRQQFNTAIGKFEGVAEILGRIGAYTYILEATRTFTTTAIDLGEKPGIITAMAKYHTTELARKILNDAMDIHAGRAIQLGPLNYLANHYFGMPVAITVEGANILTRNLMIFGQGATRCHPFLLAEMQASSDENEEKGKEKFEKLLLKHIGFSSKNILLSLVNALSRSWINFPPTIGPTADYYRQLSRFSRAFSVISDVSMLSLGGSLKKREMLSARLGDILSHLYMASAVLKRFQDDGQQESDLPFVHYALQYCMYQCAQAFDDILKNFPNKIFALHLRLFLFPLGFHYDKPADTLAISISNILMTPNRTRDRLTHLCYFKNAECDPIGLVEMAFVAQHKAKEAEKKIKNAQNMGMIEKASREEALETALVQGVISDEELELLLNADKLVDKAIQVDTFASEWFEPKKTKKSTKRVVERA